MAAVTDEMFDAARSTFLRMPFHTVRDRDIALRAALESAFGELRTSYLQHLVDTKTARLRERLDSAHGLIESLQEELREVHRGRS
jgi:hypothetical protein